MKEGLLLARDLCPENWADSYLCFWMALPHSVSYFIFHSRLPSLSLCMVFDFISPNIDEDLSINPPAVFFFGDFNTIHKNWLTYSGGNERRSEFCYNFSITKDLIQMFNFPTWIPDCDSYSPALLDFSLFVTIVFVLQFFLHWEILIMLFSQFLFHWLDFHQVHHGMLHFIGYLMIFLVLIGTVFAMIWEIFYGKIFLNAVLLLLLVIFWVCSHWNWCIYPLLKVSSRTCLISMVFSCLCCCHSS